MEIMNCKRRRVADDSDESGRPPKRPRLLRPKFPSPAIPPPDGIDRLSRLSDELVLRILSFLPLENLLSVPTVSRRFNRLSADSSLWRALYYARFVLPRTLRIPRFRDGVGRDSKPSCSLRRSFLVDRRRVGYLNPVPTIEREQKRCWKQQYKLRHNWARGKCAVEELLMGAEDDNLIKSEYEGRLLAKVINGIAVTADQTAGLRAWNLKTKEMIAQMSLQDSRGNKATPSSLAIDDQGTANKELDIAVGFVDGAFGLWSLNLSSHELFRRYRRDTSATGELVAISVSYPFLLMATESVQISLFCFAEDIQSGKEYVPTNSDSKSKFSKLLRPPQLVKRLRSHTSRAPLALSIRKQAASVIASVAYTFSTIQGWSIGIQDLIIDTPPLAKWASKVMTTRVAYTDPVVTGRPGLASLLRQVLSEPANDDDSTGVNPSIRSTSSRTFLTSTASGPTTICYSHPYLLATLPDNTLLLYLCTSTSTSLSIGPGMRLWGHTSGISDAEITARGKAVSVSRHGEEIRVWELEGRATGKSVEVRPAESDLRTASADNEEWDARRNWVGFDDEMVIVLKEAKRGRQSLVVYDFS